MELSPTEEITKQIRFIHGWRGRGLKLEQIRLLFVVDSSEGEVDGSKLLNTTLTFLPLTVTLIEATPSGDNGTYRMRK